MTRAQWLLVGFIGVVAVVAYVKADRIARRLGIQGTLYQGTNEITT